MQFYISTQIYARSNLTGTVRSLSNRWVEGTRCPPILATKFTRSDESRWLLVTVDEERICALFFLTGEGEVAGEAGAPMTWTISCVSTL